MASSFEHWPASPREVLASFGRTTIFCLAIGFTLWLLELAQPLWAGIVISLCIGYATNGAYMVLPRLLMPFVPTIAALAITTLIGVSAGVALGGLLILGDAAFLFRDEDYSTLILGLFFGVLGLLFFTTQSRLKTAQAALARADAERLGREKALLEAQLRLLQAQIEPHFLFNTLSNVVGMIREQPADAEKMLIDLTTLLRANLKRTRTVETTLGDELTVVEALLEINRVRMGNRLTWTVDVDETLRQTPLPPLLVQPLVENAVKHGIEPVEEGGSISIHAKSIDGRLTVTVEDDGAGSTGTPTDPAGGVGLANVQSRLAALFGAEASLTLEENASRGMVATLSVPVSAA